VYDKQRNILCREHLRSELLTSPDETNFVYPATVKNHNPVHRSISVWKSSGQQHQVRDVKR